MHRAEAVGESDRPAIARSQPEPPVIVGQDDQLYPVAAA
jgi:hypothetical protein